MDLTVSSKLMNSCFKEKGNTMKDVYKKSDKKRQKKFEELLSARSDLNNPS